MHALAEEAGRIVLEMYATEFKVFEKGPGDLVTSADKKANALLCEGLEEAFPGVPIVAEESDPSTYEGFADAPSAFFVDPIDGTNEFVARNGEFVVMLGFAEAGIAKAGVIHSPTRGLTWSGAMGIGAFESDRKGNRRPLAVSPVQHLPETRIVVSRSRKNQMLSETLARLQVRHVRPLGSAGLKAATVALGDAEAYVHLGNSGSLWDLCAPDALVTAAGGRFTDSAGNPISYQHNDLVHRAGIIASNAQIHDQLREAFNVVR